MGQMNIPNDLQQGFSKGLKWKSKKKNTIFKKFCSETEQCPVSKFLNNILELKIEQILEKNVMGHDCVLRVT